MVTIFLASRAPNEGVSWTCMAYSRLLFLRREATAKECILLSKSAPNLWLDTDTQAGMEFRKNQALASWASEVEN